MKFNIAICDDDSFYLTTTVNETKKYLSTHGISGKIYSSSDPNKILKEALSVEFTILIVDIKLNDINGIDVAKKINKISPETKIIYMTSHSGYLQDVYDSEHIYTILKPQLLDRLPKALGKAFSFILASEDQIITVNYKNRTSVIGVRSIMYLEKELRKMHFICTNESYESYYKTNEVLELLPKDIFVQAHRAYIVNITYIKQIVNNEIILINGTVLPIGRKYNKDLKQKIFNLATK